MLVEAALAIMAMGEGGDLIHKSINENGNYDPADEDPPVDGYNYVSVSVETYEDELAQALADLAAAQAQLDEMTECCEDVAEILGAVPEEGQSCCDAVKGKAQETVDENEEYEECCNDVAREVGLDPTDPDFDPTDIIPAIRDKEGFEFPAGTEYNPDIVSIVGDAHVTDETLGITLIWRYTHYGDYGANGWEAYYVQNGEEHYITASSNTFSSCIMTFKSIKVIDSTTGKLEILWDYTYHGGSYTWHESTYPTVSDLVGFGSSGHEYKVKNI